MPFDRKDKSDPDEILFHDGQKINEGSKSNVFFVFDELIVTPPKEQNILLGVTRNYFLKRLSEEGFTVSEREVRIEDLNKEDEIWLNTSTKEIQPVHQVDDVVLPEKKLEEYYWYKALKVLEEDLKSYC